MNPLLLAPMAGVNDPAFRAICRRLGAGLSYTEMISAQGLAHGNAHTWEMLCRLPEEGPFAVQLFGSMPAVLAEQARRLQRRLGESLTLIDINMGCPAKKVLAGGGGAALLRNPELAGQIITAVAESVNLPVTVKIRKGFAAGESSACEFAQMAQAKGAAAVAVHGRTAAQMYRGEADRNLPGELARALDIPVIASGDVYQPADALAYLRSGVAAVMFASGTRGNPWIFRQTAALLAAEADDVAGVQHRDLWVTSKSAPLATAVSPLDVSLAERIKVAEEHTRLLQQLQPWRLLSMRRHLAWYFKGTPVAGAVRRSVQGASQLDDFLAILHALRGQG